MGKSFSVCVCGTKDDLLMDAFYSENVLLEQWCVAFDIRLRPAFTSRDVQHKFSLLR